MFVIKAAVLWLLGASLVVAGALGVVYCVGLLAWQYITLVQTEVWPVLSLKALFAGPAVLPDSVAGASLIPQLSWPWLTNPQSLQALHAPVLWILEQIPLGVPFAVLGACMILLGVRMVMRQRLVFAVGWRRRQDRLRRRAAYREPAARVEPTLTPVEQRVASNLSGKIA